MRKDTNVNPLLDTWDGPHGTPPFSRIKPRHFIPALENEIKNAAGEIREITANPEPANFVNTIEALERTGTRLGQVSSLLYNINSAETNDALQKVAQDASPLLTRFSNNITLNRKLFARVKAVYDSSHEGRYDPEERELLEKHYRGFMLGGAALKSEKRRRYRKITELIAALSLKFEENLLAETNAFFLHTESLSDLEGLPDWFIENASHEAKSRKLKGWVFTLHFPSYMPFMQYSARPDLRKRMFMAYASRCFNRNEHDNRRIVTRIVKLRLELAHILGYKSYASMILGDRMAADPAQVYTFLRELHSASRMAAIRDVTRISDYARKEGHIGKIERWDWAFYSERLKKALYSIDDEILKPFFRLDSAEKALFDLAERLYGLTFVKNESIEVYHKDVSAFEVFDENKRFLAVLYTDYHPRKGKNGGAWMTSYREQKTENGKETRPLISIVANFTIPSATRPSLLSFSELTTFLHEFGHALHGMLSRCRYESLSGTNVARDFVELPSQFMENYAYEKEWLDTWARHYETGEAISEDIIGKLKDSSTFNEGYACQRQLGFSFLDMAWHTINGAENLNIVESEKRAMRRTDHLPQVAGTCVSTSFGHIFSGGYAAGYYGYKWSEVLDADAFSLFSGKGIFSREAADSFRSNILEKGASEKPMELYIRFRGKKPTPDAFLRRSGLDVNKTG